MMPIILTGRGDEVLVDEDDLERLSTVNWHLSKGYPARNVWMEDGKRRLHYLHREVMRMPRTDPRKVDHINGNPLDNRKTNLRYCTDAENIRNRGAPVTNASGFKGVSWSPREKRWRATIVKDGKQKYLGVFKDPELAHEIYCLAADMLHGEFANHGVK